MVATLCLSCSPRAALWRLLGEPPNNHDLSLLWLPFVLLMQPGRLKGWLRRNSGER